MIEVPGGRRVLLDAAHNPAGAWALAAYLRSEFPEPLPLVFGAMRDKDVTLMLKALLPVAAKIIMTEPPNARSCPAEELAEIAGKLSPNTEIDIEKNPRAALARAWVHCPVACVAGSIFLVGALLGDLGPTVREL
jgi:dihydrofolate synthase/folylpolyglutamate synthase